jgi:hypothetical protein
LADRETSSANRPEILLDATARSCQAERCRTNRADLARAKSSTPIRPDHSLEAVDGAVHPLSNIELMTQKKVFDFKPAW